MSDINTYIWKDRRLTKDRKEKAAEYKMVSMSEDELQIAYNHCKCMLYNDDHKNPGRMLVLDLISEQLEKCGAELALRWFKSAKDSNDNFKYSEENLLEELREWMISKGPVDKDVVVRLQDVVEVPPEYKGVPIKTLMEACKDNLGYFDSSKISLSFIYRMGLYFTHKELKDLDTYSISKGLKEKFEILKYQLDLGDDVELKADPSGLTEQQFRDMIHLKRYKGYYKCKYSELTTSQLETLRKKVLYRLEEEVLRQVSMWNTLMSQIQEVAKVKGYIVE